MRALLAALVLALIAGGQAVVRAQEAQSNGIPLLLRRLERIVQRGDIAGYTALLSDSADRARVTQFASSEIAPGATRVVIQERDREALPGTLPGDGHRLVVDVFEEYGARARISTWRLDVKRLGEAGTDDEWLIADQERVTSVENLYKLSLNPSRQFRARGLKITAEDLDLTLTDGSVFVSDTDQGTTAIVLLGRGEMTFRPAPETEKGQVRIFAGSDAIETRFDGAFLRIHPTDFDSLLSSDELVAATVDQREFRNADKIFREESPKSFGLDLGDLSRDPWSLLPPPGDFLAEVRTRRFDTLTYTRSSAEREDITVFDRKRGRNIAMYVSRERLAEQVLPSDEERGDYDVVNYEIDVTASPGREWIEGRARLSLTVRAGALATMTFRLANELAVQSVVSAEYGRLFAIRVRNQNSIVVNLPALVLRDTTLTLTFTYAGRLQPQTPDRESLQTEGRFQDQSVFFNAEPSFLYSNRSNWYPQPGASDYATATLRITVPYALDCVASGDPEPGSPTLIPAGNSSQATKLYVFSARQPVRYLAFLLSRFVLAQNIAIGFSPTTAPPSERPAGASYRTLNLSVETNPRQVGRGREVGDRAVAIALFYQMLLDDCPYPSFTVAVVENDLPGGHSPGYFAELNQPLPTSPYVWRNDPTYFENFPDFFIAHEFAHQWWGQAVGWRNYHEQWLSEGFAQYFAALYAQRQRGDAVFAGVMRQMRKSAMAVSDQGPISLGYRLGHLRGDAGVFRALVYNKGAATLHMLRRLVGDEAFFDGVRRFYRLFRFRHASTDDFREAMEAASDRSLERFFDRWIYGSTLPRVKVTHRIDGGDVILSAEQLGDIFDFPLTLTLQYANGTRRNVPILMTDRTAEMRVPLAGTLRSVAVNTDDGTLAEIVKN